MTSPYLTTPEAAELLRLNRYTLGKLVRAGHLVRGVHFFDGPRKGVRGRAHRLWKRSALIEWVERREKPDQDGERFLLAESSRVA